MANEAQDETGPDESVPEVAWNEAAAALARLERALDRIGQSAHPGAPADKAEPVLAAQIARRLDALIAQVRHALADRTGHE